MKRIGFALLGAVPIVDGLAGAQASSSYLLEAHSLVSGGRAAASPGYAVNGALPPATGSEATSTNYQLATGLLAFFDPLATGTNAPLLFGLVPEAGPIAGSSSVLLSGLHFDQPPLAVTFAGSAASNVTVVSGTTLSCMTPSGPSGPTQVSVSSPLGSDAQPAGFVYTPAVTASPTVVPGGALVLRNYGPAGGGFQTFFSIGPAFIPFPPFGTILIDPSLLIVVAAGAYPPATLPATTGAKTTSIPIPAGPSLVGAQFYFQSVAFVGGNPPIVLTNLATSTVIP